VEGAGDIRHELRVGPTIDEQPAQASGPVDGRGGQVWRERDGGSAESGPVAVLLEARPAGWGWHGRDTFGATGRWED